MDLKKNFWLNDSHDDCKKPKVNQEKLYNSIPVHSKEPKFEKVSLLLRIFYFLLFNFKLRVHRF